MNETTLLAKLATLAKDRPAMLDAIERIVDRLLANNGGQLTEREVKTAIAEALKKK
jgi:hypothetical protein